MTRCLGVLSGASHQLRHVVTGRVRYLVVVVPVLTTGLGFRGRYLVDPSHVTPSRSLMTR